MNDKTETKECFLKFGYVWFNLVISIGCYISWILIFIIDSKMILNHLKHDLNKRKNKFLLDLYVNIRYKLVHQHMTYFWNTNNVICERMYIGKKIQLLGEWYTYEKIDIMHINETYIAQINPIDEFQAITNWMFYNLQFMRKFQNKNT